MKLVVGTILLACLLGCGTSEKLIHARGPADGSQGIDVELDSGPLGATGSLRGVGEYTSVPSGWTGPIPPGWTRPDVPPEPEAPE